jgi:hypothetical protein
VYDAYLDAELPQMYDRASLARRGAGALLVRRFENVLAGLHTLVADDRGGRAGGERASR